MSEYGTLETFYSHFRTIERPGIQAVVAEEDDEVENLVNPDKCKIQTKKKRIKLSHPDVKERFFIKWSENNKMVDDEGYGAVVRLRSEQDKNHFISIKFLRRGKVSRVCFVKIMLHL